MKLTKINLLIMEWNNNGQWNKKKKNRWFEFFSKNIQSEKSLHVNIYCINKQQEKLRNIARS